MNTKRKLSPVIISLVLVMMLAVVPMLAFTSSAESDVTVKFAVPDGLTAPQSQTVSAGSSITLPELPNYENYTKLGWTTEKVVDTTEVPVYYEENSSYTASKDVKLYALYSYEEGGANVYVKTDIADISADDVVVITVTKGSSTYAMSNDKGTGSAPAAVSVTVSNNEITSKVDDNIKWNIYSYGNGEYTIYVNGTTAKWLYSTNTNNGTRVGTNTNKTYKIDASSGYLYHIGSGRYTGVYNNSDWRGYTSVNNNISGQTLAFFKLLSSQTFYTTGTVTETNTISFSAPAGITVNSKSATTGSEIDLPKVSAPAGLEQYTFAGWTNTDLIGDTYVAPTLYTETYTVEADETLYAVFSTASDTDIYTLTTDVADLAIGDKIIIVAKNANYALSTEDKGNNRGQTEIEKTENIIIPTRTTQIIVVEAGSIEGTYAFNVDSKYLTANGTGSNNHLKTITLASINDFASFSIEITDGTATIKGNGGNERNWLRYNSQSSIFSCYGSGQQDVSIYKSVGNATIYTTKLCAHEEDNGTVTRDASCIVSGIITYNCQHCGNFMREEEIPMLNHTPDGGTVSKDPTCTATGTLQYNCSVCGSKTSTETIPMIGHTYVDGVCETCGKADPATLDFSGRYYIAGIRSDEETYKYATIIPSSNRVLLLDSGLAELPEEITAPSGVSTFVFEKLEDGSYIIYSEGILDDAKYIGYSVSGTTHKIVFVTRDEAEALDITALDDGTVSIIGKSSGRFLTFNGKAGTDYCAWYSAGQLAGVSLVPVAEDAAITLPEITGASITIGADLAMKYRVQLPAEFAGSKLKMVFTLGNGEAVEVTKSDIVDGKYVFTFTGIAPQAMTDNIKAELYVNNHLTAIKDNYSIKQNAINILADDPDNAALRTLISDMLAYGAAAQEYRNYNKDNLANAGIEGLTPSETVPGLPDRYATKSTSEDVYFISAGVHFDYANKMYAKLYAKEGTSFEVYINGTEAYWNKINDTTYIVYTDFISATAFDVSAEFVLKVDGVDVQTLTYNVNSYAYSQFEIDDNMGRLALALYRYGVSAKAYAENN